MTLYLVLKHISHFMPPKQEIDYSKLKINTRLRYKDTKDLTIA